MNRSLFLACVILSLGASTLTAQKYFTKSGEISFFSQAPLEKIEAINKSVTSVLDLESGRMEFALLVKSFHFEKALMQEHFNENYMESSKYPKAVFKGQIQNISDIQFDVDGEYIAHVEGEITIHGKTKSISTEGKIIISKNQISAESEFNVTVADYDITIPKVVRDNIAKEVAIQVNLTYQPL